MPKIIENLRADILSAARETLLRDGYGALTIRKVAETCGIAVGTVYNYFASKELLAAAVMLEDWQSALGEIRCGCRAASDIPDGLTAAYQAVSRFSARYRPSWASYSFRGSQQSDYAKRHRMLVRQLADCLLPLLSRTGAEFPASLPLFLAENILVCVDGSELTFSDLLELLRPVLAAAHLEI